MLASKNSMRNASSPRNRHVQLECSRCNKHFSTQQSLKSHLQFHTGQFTAYCDLCRRGFTRSGHYKEHMRSHEGLKYNCEYCSKQFYLQTRPTVSFINSYWQLQIFVWKMQNGFQQKIAVWKTSDKPCLNNLFPKHIEFHYQSVQKPQNESLSGLCTVCFVLFLKK